MMPQSTNQYPTLQINPQQLTNTILSIAALPSAPTYDWTTHAARALTRIHPNTTIGLAIATLSPDRSRITTESTGIGHHWNTDEHHTTTARSNTQKKDPHALTQEIDPDHARSSLDRVDATPINLTQQAQLSGLVTYSHKLLPNWHASPISEPWRANQFINPTNTIAAYAPISTHNTPHTQDTQAHNTTPCMLILASSSNPKHPLDPTMLAAAISALVYKARSTFNIQSSTNQLSSKAHSFNWLTQREQTILDHLVLGKSVRVIAEHIGRSPHTVHDHVKNLHRKLNATSRGQLIARALGDSAPPAFNELLEPIIDPKLRSISNTDLLESPEYKSPDQTNRNTAPELKLTQPVQDTPSSNPNPTRLRATPLTRLAQDSRAAL